MVVPAATRTAVGSVIPRNAPRYFARQRDERPWASQRHVTVSTWPLRSYSMTRVCWAMTVEAGQTPRRRRGGAVSQLLPMLGFGQLGR